MFLFAHVGITLGAASTVSAVIAKWPRLPRRELSDHAQTLPKSKTKDKKESISERIGLKALSMFLDIRILMIGALVPDIIDKPLGFLGFGNGRSITHTLLILLIVLFIGLYLHKNYKKTWLLAIVIGMFTHLILDSMWATPQTLLWPLYGWAFPVPDHKIGLGQINLWWHTLITNPGVDISEAFGLLILTGFIVILVHERRFKTFLRKGRV
jgi:membrane-bound metal-dependent hydrolase YbcI (DUF457 family)